MDLIAEGRITENLIEPPFELVDKSEVLISKRVEIVTD